MMRAFDVEHNKGIIAQVVPSLDEAFQRYVVRSLKTHVRTYLTHSQIALEQFVGKKVNEIRDVVAQILREVEQEGRFPRVCKPFLLILFQ